MRKNIAMVLAGGIGSRLGTDVPKQYILINNKPVIIYTLETLQAINDIDDIIIVANKNWYEFIYNQCEMHSITKLKTICEAGEDGIHSIWNGFEFIFKNYSLKDVVIIQDANRPLTVKEDIISGLKLVEKTGCAVSILSQVNDMIFVNGQEQNLVKRDNLWQIIRPEYHTVENLLHCKFLFDNNESLLQNPTCILLKNGDLVSTFKSNSISLKITYPEDLEFFNAVLYKRSN